MEIKEDFGFKDLIVWQKSIEFAKNVIDKTNNLKSERRHFRITEQLEAAATSISANIAEGKGRYSKKEFTQFLYIARGSLYETVTFLNILKELNWIPAEEVEKVEKEGLILNKMLNSLINSLKSH